jgi:acyl carrier protein
MLVLSLKNILNKMTKEEIIIKLSTIVKPYIQNEEGFKNISEDTDFMNDLEINSANLVDIVLDVEDEFNIIIDNDSMDKMLTIKSVVEIIKEKQSSE